jgi:hypothetical protein
MNTTAALVYHIRPKLAKRTALVSSSLFANQPSLRYNEAEGNAMTLELSKVTEQVDQMGQALAGRAWRQQQALPALRALRQSLADDPERLLALAESSIGREARCAAPTHERLDATFASPEPPVPATILATDGSQIYPDPHGLALYYLINVGSLVYRHGSEQAPGAASEPQAAEAVDSDGNLLTAEQLSVRRDLAEIRRLADLAKAEGAGEPLVALLDSTIGLRAWSGTIPQAEQEALHRDYLAQLDRLCRAGAALAGVLSRSRQAGVVKLLDLGRLEEAAAPPPELSPFRGLTDQMLWGDLQPGERSALFWQPGALPVHFFYLNTDPPEWPRVPGVEAEPARIEVPEWVARNPEKLGWVHSLVYDQCRINNGYPYALTRADELAIILNEEREALETMILQAMSRQGMPLPRVSLKAAQKRVARAPFRR